LRGLKKAVFEVKDNWKSSHQAETKGVTGLKRTVKALAVHQGMSVRTEKNRGGVVETVRRKKTYEREEIEEEEKKKKKKKRREGEMTRKKRNEDKRK
jgi:hypothetical protein